MSRPLAITGVRTHDVRFPTSREQDGSDALNLGDYSAAYVVLETGDSIVARAASGVRVCVAVMVSPCLRRP